VKPAFSSLEARAVAGAADRARRRDRLDGRVRIDRLGRRRLLRPKTKAIVVEVAHSSNRCVKTLVHELVADRGTEATALGSVTSSGTSINASAGASARSAWPPMPHSDVITRRQIGAFCFPHLHIVQRAVGMDPSGSRRALEKAEWPNSAASTAHAFNLTGWYAFSDHSPIVATFED
jgi:hypothetical protein